MALGAAPAALARRRRDEPAQRVAGRGDDAAGAEQPPARVYASGLLFGGVFLSAVASTTALVRHNLPEAEWGQWIGA
jgi:hypothetical protein